MEVSGRIGTFEGERLRGSIMRRVLGKWRHIGIAIMIVIGLLVGLGMGPISRYAGIPYAASNWLIAGLILAAIGAAMMFAFTAYWLRKGWYARGTPVEANVTYSVTRDGLLMTTESSTIVLKWPYFSEVFRIGEYWVLLGAGTFCFLPCRLFTSPVQEREFLAAVFEYLPPATKAKSPDAERFLSSS
ncbi:MAG: hypothetical protein Q8N31_13760 [Reyranella sp.]|nr:hypothetical protein [Reyranella sp.]